MQDSEHHPKDSRGTGRHGRGPPRMPPALVFLRARHDYQPSVTKGALDRKGDGLQRPRRPGPVVLGRIRVGVADEVQLFPRNTRH
jgi:hypothetical protein